MAKIFGIEIRNLKNSRGHEGEPCPYGMIYMDGEKLGLFATDTWGGESAFGLTDAQRDNLFARIAQYFKTHPHIAFGINNKSPEIFMDILIELTYDEKRFSKFVAADTKKRGTQLPWQFVRLIFNAKSDNEVPKEESYDCPNSELLQKLLSQKKPDSYHAFSIGKFIIE